MPYFASEMARRNIDHLGLLISITQNKPSKSLPILDAMQTASDFILHLQECIYNYQRDETLLQQLIQRLVTLTKSLVDVTDNTKFVDILTSIRETFDTYYVRDCLTLINRTTEEYTCAYHPNSWHIHFSERRNNILFIDCRSSYVSSKLSLLPQTDKIHCETYGLYRQEYNSKRSIQDFAYHHLIYGEGKMQLIEQNAFDVLVISPNCSTYTGSNDYTHKFKREEIRQIQDYMKCLRVTGIFQMCIPYFRVDTELRRMLTKYLDDIRIYRIDDIFIEIMGRKKENHTLNVAGDNLLSALYETHENLPTLYVEDTFYELPLDAKTITQFRGSIITNAMIRSLRKNSTCADDFIAEQNLKLETTGESLLPFNNGQIGLILASGYLDGLIEEKDGGAHLIKGKIEKIREECTVNDDEITRVYNSIKITAVTTEGRCIDIK